MNVVLNSFDYVIIAFYFVFMLMIGWVLRRASKNSSDFFRGGGRMLWWLAGTSSVVAGFSAMTFTGMAAKVYRDGLQLPAVFMTTMILGFPILWWIAPRFRRMRVITSVEAVRRRFGNLPEQLLTWFSLLVGLWYGGFGLVTVSTFVSAALGMDIQLVAIVLGVVVTAMSVGGGSWAVIASDFVQALIVFSTMVLLTILAILHLGSPLELFSNLPEHHVVWGTADWRIDIIGLWFAVMVINSLTQQTDMLGSGSRFLFVRDDKQARKMVIFITILWILEAPLAFIPASVSAAVFSPTELQTMFPNLAEPEAGCLVALSAKLLPTGMLGVLLCAIFAAAMTTLDTGLNKAAGIYVRNFYLPIINPQADETKQLKLGRLVTIIFGAAMIVIALIVFALPGLKLFDLAMIVFSAINAPLALTMALGAVYKKTPSWSAWAAPLFGMVTALTVQFGIDPNWYARLTGGAELTANEAVSVSWCSMTLAMIVAVTTVFFISSLFYRLSSPDYRANVEALFTDMNTPITHEEDQRETLTHELMQYRLLGFLSMILGVAVILCILIPNSVSGRLCYLYTGIPITLVGGVLYAVYLRKRQQLAQMTDSKQSNESAKGDGDEDISK